MYKILVVEDEKILRDAFAILLQPHYDVTVAANGQEALDVCRTQTFHVILLDLMMPILDGVGFLKTADLQQSAPRTRIIALTNLSSGEAFVAVKELGAHRQEVKANLSPDEILTIIKSELDTYEHHPRDTSQN